MPCRATHWFRLVIHHDDAAVGATVLGGVAVRFNAKLDGIDNWGRPVRAPAEDADAVVDVLAHAGPASVNARESRRRRHMTPGESAIRGWS